MTLEAATLRLLDIPKALASELEDPPRLLPSRVIEAATAQHADEYAELLQELAQTGFEPSQQELVWASKSRLAHRPLSVLPLRDRVLYRALVQTLVPRLAPYDKRQLDYAEFENAPLALDDVRFVVSADVSAYYQYVDHALLARRIVESAGRADVARTLAGFLGGVFNRRFGLPQDNRTSDVLGELYIAPVERALGRSGLSIARYNDDFRIATLSLREAYESLERLQTELHPIGLTLNEEKSRVRRADTYEAGLGLVDKRVEEVLAAQPVDLTRFDSYTGEPLEPSPEEVAEALREADMNAGQSLFEESVEKLAEVTDIVERLVLRELVRRSLTILGAGDSPAVVGQGSRVLALDPSLSPAYSRYLRRIAAAGDGEAAVSEAVSLLGPTASAPAWQQAWLLQPLLLRSVSLPEQAEAPLQLLAGGRASAVIRARAVLVLAIHKRVTDKKVGQEFQAAPSAARPDLAAAAALARRTSADAVSAIRGEAREYEWVVARAERDPSDTAWL